MRGAGRVGGFMAAFVVASCSEPFRAAPDQDAGSGGSHGDAAVGTGGEAGRSTGGSGGTPGSGGTGGIGILDGGGVSCLEPLADCDAFPGCETDTSSSLTHCGGCNQPCSGVCNTGDCITPKIIFLSSRWLNGNMGGIEGASRTCNELAVAAGLSGTFQPWLSSSTWSPGSRMQRSTGPYVLTTGQRVAENWDDLTDGTLLSPIDRDENGQTPAISYICQGGEVWSNATPFGTVASNQSCVDWTSTGATSGTGNYRFADANWSQSDCFSVACSSSLPIYCVQQ